jgi:hypothetical protein
VCVYNFFSDLRFAGMEAAQGQRAQSHTEDDLTDTSSIHRTRVSSASAQSSDLDLEWDDTFVSADDQERRQLIGISSRSDSSVR